MEISKTRSDRAVRFLSGAAALIAFLVFAVIAAASLVMTCSIDPAAYQNETILYKIDNVPVNLIVLAAVFALGILEFGVKRRVPSERTVRIVSAVSLLFVAATGIAWVTLVNCVPEYDSHYLTHAASLASRNDYSYLTEVDYYVRFPFQLGYISILELLQRVFGADNYIALGIVNVAALVGGYAFLFDGTKTLCADTRVRLVTALLPLLFLQGPLFATFIYGNLAGFCFAMGAAALFLRWLNGEGAHRLIPAVPMLALAILAKPNYWIWLVAFAVISLMQLIRKKDLRGLCFVLAAGLLASGALKLCTARYERKTGTVFGEGTPQTAWLAMGMHGSYMAPGWYNGYTTHIFRDFDYDTEKTKAQIRLDLKENLAKMKDPVYCAAFFGRKLLSQFEETSFESIFVSKDAQNGRHVPGIVEWVYRDGETGLLRGFDLVMQNVYVFAAADLFLLWSVIRKRKRGRYPLAHGEEDMPLPACGILHILFPVILLGGFFYHMLFEGKSQYILVYIPLLFPLAAHGFTTLCDAAAVRTGKRKTSFAAADVPKSEKPAEK